MIDAVVVEHYGERLAAIGPEHVPAGWELIHLVGGPYATARTSFGPTRSRTWIFLSL